MAYSIAYKAHAAHHKEDAQRRTSKGECCAAQSGTCHKLIVKKGSKNADHTQIPQ